MQVIDNKALLFVTRRALQVTNLIPKSRILETNGDLAKVLVRWGLDEVQILRNLGIKDVPSPILGAYNWPGMFTPFAHQKETADFLTLHHRCYNFSEAGTGKTSAAAWAADYLMTQGKIKRVLVVCPVSIMDTAWRADLFRTAMHRTVAIAMGSREQRVAIINGGYEFIIINYDGVKVVRQELLAAGFDLVIVDEANAVKNVGTGRWKALASLLLPHTRLWMMTGTPAAQSPEDAYGLGKMLAPASVPRFQGAWRDKVMTKATQYKWVPKPDAQQTVFHVLQPAIRYTKEQCLDLPDMMYVDRVAPMTAMQQNYYDAIRNEMLAEASGVTITAVNAAVKVTKLLQIAQGAVYGDDKEVVLFDVKNRLSELLAVIDETPHKVIVFVPYKHSMEMLLDAMAKHHIPAEAIHGGVPAGRRADIIKQFQSEDTPRVLLLQPQATAHGITLTRADQVVWWGPTSSAELYIQANARAHRAGQINKVTVTHLRGSPVEKRMYAMLQGKLDSHQSLVDLYREEIGLTP